MDNCWKYSGNDFKSTKERYFINDLQSVWQSLEMTWSGAWPWYLREKNLEKCKRIRDIKAQLVSLIYTIWNGDSFPIRYFWWHFYYSLTCTCLVSFYAPIPDRMIGGILFCPVCLSVINFNLRYNFWTIRDGDFIFGMHTPLMMPSQMTPKSMTLWPWLTSVLKKTFWTLLRPGT